MDSRGYLGKMKADESQTKACSYPYMSTEMKDNIENIVFSYDTGSQKLAEIFDSTCQILQNYQEYLLAKNGRQKSINTELRENLAKNESLRRKDFNNMMQEIFLPLDIKEREVKRLLNIYLDDQRQMAKALRENFRDIKKYLADGDLQKGETCHKIIMNILSKENETKGGEVTSKLKSFQKEQQHMAKTLESLSAKGKELKLWDFKLVIKKFKIR